MRSRREGYRVRRRIRWSRVFLLIAVLMVFLASLAGAGMYAYLRYAAAPASGAPNVGAAADKSAQSDTLNKRINVLILGVDDGDNETPGAPRRSDTMMVASINPEDATVNLLSIPRDTKVNIAGHKGSDKITHAYAYGGPDLAVRTVESLLNIPINYYVTLNWQGFIKVVDILGGVDLYVENAMNYEDPYENLSIHLQKGYQHLDGYNAGGYVRFRHDELGDIGRVQRQQRFMKALSNQMLQMGTILKLPALVSAIDQNMETNMPAMTMMKLANTLKSFKTDSLQAEMLPGNFATIDGLSYWVADSEQTKQLVQRMFTGAATKVSDAGHPASRVN